MWSTVFQKIGLQSNQYKTMEMTDFLLKFDSKEQAVEFATNNGYMAVDTDEEGNEISVPLLQGDKYVYTVIGEHIYPTNETETMRDEGGNEWEQPIMEGDGNHWILFRTWDDNLDTSIAEDYIVWNSKETTRVRRRDENGQFIGDDPNTENDEAWEDEPVPRPENAPRREFM